jgi:hypothetical protein
MLHLYSLVLGAAGWVPNELFILHIVLIYLPNGVIQSLIYAHMLQFSHAQATRFSVDLTMVARS